MRYDLKEQTEVDKAADYLSELARFEAEVEIKRILPTRSLKQNNYLHLILTAFGMHFGYTLEESKMLYKYINKDLYHYEHKGHPFWRSSADLDKDEMARSIDTFRLASERQGCELPLAIDQAWLRNIRNDAERMNYR